MLEEIQLLSFKRAFYPGHSPFVSCARVVVNSKGLYPRLGRCIFVLDSVTFHLKHMYLYIAEIIGRDIVSSSFITALCDS